MRRGMPVSKAEWSLPDVVATIFLASIGTFVLFVIGLWVVVTFISDKAQ